MSIITFWKVNVFARGKESHEYFNVCIIIKNNTCNTTFYSYKISNPVVNGIIFSAPNNNKYLVPS